MPASGLRRRFDRARTRLSREERDGGSSRNHRPQHVNRQVEVPPLPVPFPTPPAPSSRAGPPSFLPSGPPSVLRPPPGVSDNDFAPGDETSDDGHSEGDNSDDEEGGTTENPFAPTTTTASEPQQSIAATTTATNPFTKDVNASSIGTSSPGAFFPSASATAQTSIPDNQHSPSAATETAYTTTPTMFSTSLTPSGLSATGDTVMAAPVSTSTISSTNVPDALNHPIAKAAVVMPSVFGSFAAIAALYLLFRYCAPVRARWAIYRAGRGQRLSEEEDGLTPTAAPQVTEVYATRTVETSRGSLSEPSLPLTPITPMLSFIRGTAVALPFTTTRVPPPVLVRNFSNRTPQNPRDGRPALSRSNSGDTGAIADGYGTYAFNFNHSEYAASRISDQISEGHSGHPSGLENNQTTPVAHKSSVASNSDKTNPKPNVLSVGSDSGLRMGFPLPPTTPSAAHFGPNTPPESIVNYSPQRLHKSITPSESISNVPDSPFPLTPGLMPPLPILNSRWSTNSSSVNGQILADAMNMGPTQDGRGTGPNARPLSRFPSLQSSSSPIRHGSKQA